MNNTFKNIALAILIILPVFLSSCTKKDEQQTNALIGTWNYNGYSSTMISSGMTITTTATCNAGSTITFNTDKTAPVKITGGTAQVSYGSTSQTTTIPASTTTGTYEYDGNKTINFMDNSGEVTVAEITTFTSKQLNMKVVINQSGSTGEILYYYSK